MKIVAGILVGAVGAAAATFAILQPVAERKATAARAELQARFDAERQQLEADVAAARRAAGAPVTAPFPSQVPSARASELTPAELVQKLSQTRVTPGPARIRTLRGIIYDLGRLADLRDAAVPDIRGYLVRFDDVEYGTEQNAEPLSTDPVTQALQGLAGRFGGPGGQGGGGPGGAGPGGGAPPWVDMVRDFSGQRRNNTPLDFPFPPTLRLGLMDTLHQIGTPDALAALVEVLQTTGRGLEIAYTARLLEEVAPGRFKDAAIAAAHELLLNPIDTSGATGVDALQQAYLYRVLEMFNDPSFVDAARGMLVADGRLNRNAYDYLVRTLGAGALPTLHDLFNSPGLTNMADRAAIMNNAIAHVGQDSYANAMFTSILNNPELGRMREMALMSLSRGGGGRGPGAWMGGNDTPTDPVLIQQRLDFLNQLGSSVDPDLSRTLDRVTADLSRQLQDPTGSAGPAPNFRAPGGQGGQGGQGGGGRGGRGGGRGGP